MATMCLPAIPLGLDRGLYSAYEPEPIDNMIRESWSYLDNGYPSPQPRDYVQPTAPNYQHTVHDYSAPSPRDQPHLSSAEVDSQFSSPPQNTPPSDIPDDGIDVVFQPQTNYPGDSSAGRTPDSSDSVSQYNSTHVAPRNALVFQPPRSIPSIPASPVPSSSSSNAYHEVRRPQILATIPRSVGSSRPFPTHLQPGYLQQSYPNEHPSFTPSYFSSEQTDDRVHAFRAHTLHHHHLPPHPPTNAHVPRANRPPHQQQHAFILSSTSDAPEGTSPEHLVRASNHDYHANPSPNNTTHPAVSNAPLNSTGPSAAGRANSRRGRAGHETFTSVIRKRNKTIQPKSPFSDRSSASSPHAPPQTVRKGVRRRGLEKAERDQASKMRQIGSCWVCAFVKEACKPTQPGGRCERCERQAWVKKSAYSYLGCCTNVKLFELVPVFWPEHMANDYLPNALKKSEELHVAGWTDADEKTVHLTMGYGPLLTIALSEFEPRPDVMTLSQLQACRVQGPHRKFVVERKYSPPLAMKRMDLRNYHKGASEYLNDLLKPKYLRGCGEACFGGPDQGNYFLARLLQLCCNFYMYIPDRDHDSSTTDRDDVADPPKLSKDRVVFRDILRLVLLAWIMDHMFTIEGSTLNTVLHSLRTPHHAEQSLEQVSPRLANRQLKSFFVNLRAEQYKKNLNDLQQTIVGGKKHWFENFCHVLCLGVVLGQAQEIIFLNGPTRVAAKLASERDAEDDAMKACQEIDKHYSLIIRIFYGRYRTSKPTEGTFGKNTPKFDDVNRVSFLHQLMRLAQENHDHLKEARILPLHTDHGPLLSLRLVARFLTTFDALSAGELFVG